MIIKLLFKCFWKAFFFFFFCLLKASMYSHLSSSVDCLSNHLSLNFQVEWLTHLQFLSHWGVFENLSLYTLVLAVGLAAHFKNTSFIRPFCLHLIEIYFKQFSVQFPISTNICGQRDPLCPSGE